MFEQWFLIVLIDFVLILSFVDDTRELAANVRGIGIAPQEIPEWKKHVIGGKKSSFGMKTNLTLIEQRQSLPIYKLRDDLIKVSEVIFRTRLNIIQLLLLFSGGYR